MRDKELESTDRVCHELTTLCDALFYFGTIDQLNLPALIGVEVLTRRIASLVEAYANPQKMAAARYYAGAPSTEEVVAPSLRSFVSRRMRDDFEITSGQTRNLNRFGQDGRIASGGGGMGAGGGAGQAPGAEAGADKAGRGPKGGPKGGKPGRGGGGRGGGAAPSDQR